MSTTTKQVTTTNATSFDSIGAFLSITKGIASATAGLTIVNTCIAQLREAKITFGKSVKTCIYRAQLADAMRLAFPDKSDKTWANYATSVISAVNDGTEFSLSGSKGTQKAGGKKDGGTKASPEFSSLIAKIFNHPEFEKVCAACEDSYNNDEVATFHASFAAYLVSEGFEIEA